MSLAASGTAEAGPASLRPGPREPRTLRDRLLARLGSGELDLPLLPGAASELMSLTARDDTEPRQLAAVVRRDAALTAHFLRVANSPLYRARSLVVSLHQVMSRLGFAQVRQIAMTVACHEQVFRARGHEAEAQESFRHSFATALFAQEIARQRRSNVEEAFLAGLLHDIGRPALLQAIGDLRGAGDPSPRAAGVADVVLELHAAVGRELATRWSLPGSVAEAIGTHHATVAAGPSELAMLTALADDLADMALTPTFDDPSRASILAHPMLAPLNIYPDDVGLLLARSDAIVETVRTLT